MNADVLDDILKDAEFTANRVGAPGSKIRERAENTIRLVAEYRVLCHERTKLYLESDYAQSYQRVADCFALATNLSSVQARCTELLNEVRALKAKLAACPVCGDVPR